MALSLTPLSASALDRTPRFPHEASYIIQGGNAHFSKAAVDTHLLIGPWGSGSDFNGQFETPSGQPAWNGWTSIDGSQRTQESHWQVSDYNAGNLNGHGAGNLAAWCGDLAFSACDAEDPPGGYGNQWTEILQWTGLVADPAQPCLVTVDAVVNHNTEPTYDFSYFTLLRYGQEAVDLWLADGVGQNVPLHLEFTCEPADYWGADRNEVVLQFRFTSDGGWSDEDCSYPSDGALQVDDVSIVLENGGTTTFDDFESGLGNWQATIPTGTGDFAKIWTGLRDIDPCATNTSAQLAFIDDGVVVPGAGGTQCIDWCYGPGGYIVNNSGGLGGPTLTLFNLAYSPVLAWPGSNYNGCVLAWNVYRDEQLRSDSPGIGDLWMVRSTASSDPDDIESAGWMDRDSGIRSGGPYYWRSSQDVSDLLEPDTRFVQLLLGAYQWGQNFGWDGANGTPAPYFDNVRIAAFPQQGPSMKIRNTDLASDNFPEIGSIDLVDLSRNSVRFDAAYDVAWDEGSRIDPGDSVYCYLYVDRIGAELEGPPSLHYKLNPNPLFDPYRTSGRPNEGVVYGWHPTPISSGFAFDLPDTGFFFPGDVIHYFVAATDAVDGSDLRTNFVPADTTGFGDFSGPLIYDSRFTVRALPSIRSNPDAPGEFESPGTLFCYHYASQYAGREGEDEWYGAFKSLGLRESVDYDTYYSRYDNGGLASRATPAQIARYDAILYSAGNMSVNTLGNGDASGNIPDDIGLMESWLEMGGNNLLLTGSHLVYDLAVSYGPTSPAFLAQWLGVQYVDDELRPLIGNPFAPVVLAEDGGSVFEVAESWVVYTSCDSPGARTNYGIDAATILPGAERLAQFATPAGQPASYPYTAATLNEMTSYDATIISLPYDLMHIRNDTGGNKALAPMSSRAVVLGDILNFFGIPYTPGISDVPGHRALTATSFPNPFNPQTRIEFELPQAGRVSLKIYDVRGTLVRTLLDGFHAAGTGEVLWDGKNDGGATVSSSVYFYELRHLAQVRVGKMTLVR